MASESDGDEFKNRPFHTRLGDALTGLVQAWRREQSLRIQVVMAVGAIATLAAVQPRLVWWALVVFAISLVLCTELINTALEGLIDHLHPEHHPELRFVKDVAAGAVLAASLAAILVGIAMMLSVFIDH